MRRLIGFIGPKTMKISELAQQPLSPTLNVILPLSNIPRIINRRPFFGFCATVARASTESSTEVLAGLVDRVTSTMTKTGPAC
jgi:hypothetical protein